MEEQINKLKLTYLSTKTPEFLANSGKEDLWQRVSTYREPKRFFSPTYTIPSALLVLILFVGVGFASAQSSPGSVFFPVKKLSVNTLNAVEKIVPTQISHVFTKTIHKKDISTPAVLTIPTSANIPTATPTPTIQKEERKNTTPSTHATVTPHATSRDNDSKENESSEHEDVKGTSTQKDTEDNSQNASDNSHSGEKSNNANTSKSGNSNASPNEHAEEKDSNGKNK